MRLYQLVEQTDAATFQTIGSLVLDEDSCDVKRYGQLLDHLAELGYELHRVWPIT